MEELRGIRPLFDGNSWAKEVTCGRGHQGETYYIPFVMDDQTVTRLKDYMDHISRDDRSPVVNNEGTQLWPIRIGKSTPQSAACLPQYDDVEKVYVNLLSDDGMSLLQFLWSLDPDIPKDDDELQEPELEHDDDTAMPLQKLALGKAELEGNSTDDQDFHMNECLDDTMEVVLDFDRIKDIANIACDLPEPPC